MKNTEKYFYGVSGFIEDAVEISTAFSQAVKRLEVFKGSTGYDQGVKEARAKMEADVRQMRETYLKQFRETTAKMREAVNSRPLVAPTPEQAALLTTLQMRTSLGRDELERAARQMDGCQVALSVLDDLAKKHGVRGARFNRELTADDLQGKIDTLDRAALELIREGAGAAKREIPRDVTDCLERYGRFGKIPKKGVTGYGSITSCDLETDTQTISAFCEAIG